MTNDIGQSRQRLHESINPFEFREMLLAELVSIAFKSFMDSAGLEKALATIRPYALHMGMAAANQAKVRFGLKGNDLEIVAMPLFWAYCATSRGNINQLEIRERGAVVEQYYCPLKIAPPEICLAISHNVAEGVCQTINPDYEITYTHHLPNGDSCCRHVVKKKGMGTNEDLGGVIKTIPLMIPKEEQEFFSNAIFGEMREVVLKASMDVNGPERTKELLTGPSQELGHRLGALFEKELNGIKGIRTIAEVMDFLDLALMQNGSIASESSDKIEKEITECPFRGGTVQGCHQMEMMRKGLCEAIDPDYDFQYDKKMAKGDKTCNWTITKKTAQGKVTEEVTSSDDPATMLAKRMVRGELSEEEFERKMALLKKHLSSK